MSAEQALLHKLSAVFADERGRAAGQLVLAGVEAQVVCDLVFGETGLAGAWPCPDRRCVGGRG
ncbi:hypothetical protein [Metallibacterium sp.]|uniref:hypothetical protein n=1 Tax=Metallibacterium sp. TaxID=2940281 RepID=UPI002607737E|nr:hypothetical protein [Metallibacterium sp.]